MKKEQTDLEKVYKKSKFYSNLFKISTFILLPTVVGAIYWGFKTNTDLELEKRIKGLHSNIIQIEKLSPEINYSYGKDETKELNAETFINDLVENYKYELNLKDSLHLSKQSYLHEYKSV